MGGMYRPSSYSGDDDRYEGRYGSRDDDRNGYGREREWGSRDDERYGKYGGDGDRYSRDSDERYGRDGYRDDDHRGRSRSIDDYQYGSRSRSADRERERAYEDDGQYSSRYAPLCHLLVFHGIQLLTFCFFRFYNVFSDLFTRFGLSN